VIRRIIGQQISRSSASRRPSTPTEVLARCGRLILWLTIGLLLARGAGDLVASQPPTTRPGVQRTGERAGWPDDAARAFAVEFASAYLHHAPGEPSSEYGRRIGVFVSAEIAGELIPRVPGRVPGQTVESAMVARVESVDARHALITVAAQVAAERTLVTRRLVVPVARDERGALVVHDLPSFAATAPPGRAPAPQSQPLVDPDHDQIEDMLTRFFRAYLTGATDELTYLTPPGVRIAAVAGRFELVSPVAVAEPIPPLRSRDTRLVVVAVQARDALSRAVHALRYRVQLVRRDRWYVAQINGAGEGPSR
jgi:hypothetical protein